MSFRVAVIGSSGMAGHMVTRYLWEQTGFEVCDIGPRKKTFPETLLCDLENVQAMRDLLLQIKPDALVNCTGILVQGAELKKRQAIWINAYLPRLLSECAASMDARLVHLSTDCVFSGRFGPYNENDFRDGDSFYDRTKVLGEVSEGRDLTIRTSIIGPEIRSDGTGLFQWVMQQRGEVKGFRRALWSGVTTLELAKFIHYVLEEHHGLKGLVHYSVPGGISKYQLLVEINRVFEKKLRVAPVDTPVADKRLVCTRTDLGRVPGDYVSQLVELKNWIETHADIYPTYLETT